MIFKERKNLIVSGNNEYKETVSINSVQPSLNSFSSLVGNPLDPVQWWGEASSLVNWGKGGASSGEIWIGNEIYHYHYAIKTCINLIYF